MNNNIPMQNIIGANSNVISPANASGFMPQGLLLTKNALLPTGAVMSFTSQSAVGAYFGTATGQFSEYVNAGIYFTADINTTNTPPSILIARYTDDATAPYIRGSKLLSTDISNFTSITAGTLTVQFGGVSKTATSIDTSSCTNFVQVAQVIETALRVQISTATCTFSSITNSFTISNGVVDTTVQTITDSGSVAVAMKITTANSGSVTLSQGTPAMTPVEVMDNIIQQTTNFISFTNNFAIDADPTFAVIKEFATWVGQQNNKFIFMSWSLDADLGVLPQVNTTVAYNLANNGYGTISPTGQITFNVPISLSYSNIDYVCGQIGTGASIRYENLNSVISFANKTYAGITPLATTQTQYDALSLNGCNFYGKFATRGNQYIWSENGSVGGVFLWLDNIYNQAWLEDAVQVAEANLLSSIGKLSFNDLSLLQSVIISTMAQGINNGVIQKGSIFDAQQTARLIAEAGLDITSALTNNGYYVQIPTPTPAMRANRTLVPVNIWYSNGSAVLKIVNNITLVM